MADILSEYGSDSSTPQAPRATNGGCCDPKPIPYSPPKGPIQSPQGTNHGTSGTQGKH